MSVAEFEAALQFMFSTLQDGPCRGKAQARGDHTTMQTIDHGQLFGRNRDARIDGLSITRLRGK